MTGPEPSTPLTSFLGDLASTGRVRVAPDLRIHPRDLESAGRVLEELHTLATAELPPGAPVLDRPAGLWAAATLYHACQFLVFREIPPAILGEILSRGGPAATTAGAIFSVDLTFRYLPDVRRLAAGFAEDDPLIVFLTRCAGEWPLSSVGMGIPAMKRLDPILDDPGLERLYLDRVLAREDVTRVKDRRVRLGLRSALGAFPGLAPAIAAALDGEEAR